MYFFRWPDPAPAPGGGVRSIHAPVCTAPHPSIGPQGAFSPSTSTYPTSPPTPPPLLALPPPRLPSPYLTADTEQEQHARSSQFSQQMQEDLQSQ